MTQEHPITPPPELVQQWCEQLFGCSDKPEIAAYELVRLGAQYGADQELEACVEWFCEQGYDISVHKDLYVARRPKPPSLKEQSIALLDKIQAAKEGWDISELNIIRHALEQLDD